MNYSLTIKLELIEVKRQEFCEAYYDAVMEPTTRQWKTLTEPCFRAAMALGNYFEVLKAQKIPPNKVKVSNYSPNQLLDGIKSVPDVPMLQGSCYTDRWNSCRGCTADKSSGNLTGQLRKLASSTWATKKSFLCLDCVKTGGETKEAGTCRIVHK